MSDDTWDSNEFEATSEGFKSLRSAFDKVKKDLADERKARAADSSKITELTKSLSGKSLNELTGDLPPAVKKFLAKDFDREGTEVTKENVAAWLTENGADFGYTPGQQKPATEEDTSGKDLGTPQVPRDPEADGDGSLPAEVRAAMHLLQEFEAKSQAPSPASSEVASKLESLDNPALSDKDVLAALRAMGAPVVGY